MGVRFKNLGLGVGLRPEHFQHIAINRPPLDWFEALSENYMGLCHSGAGPALENLEKIRENYEVTLHGVSLSVASADPLNMDYLKKLKELSLRIEASWISDHLCWSGVNGLNLHDLMPVPFNKAAIDHVTERVLQVQDFLGAPILLENISSYISFESSEMSEPQFLNEIARRTHCGLLIDINNIYVNSQNHHFNALEYLLDIEPSAIGQIHLAGHSTRGQLLIDTHDSPVCAEVWQLFKQSVQHFGPRASMVEWDAKIPPFDVLLEEAAKARQIIIDCKQPNGVAHAKFG